MKSTRGKGRTGLDETPQHMVAIITVSRSSVSEFLKAMWLRKHLGSLSQHLSFHEQLHCGPLVYRAAMIADNLGIEGHLTLQNSFRMRGFERVPDCMPLMHHWSTI
jgi:hypothetical protein